MEIKTDALVLRTADYGENDKMLTLFSLQYGKISAAAKGVRKPGAKLRFAAQPFCFAEYVLAEKGERHTVVSASLTDGFYALREDIGKFYAAACVTGISDAVLYGGIVNEELFLRAVSALGEMCRGNEAEALISFFLKALELSGYGLSFGACAGCGAPLAEGLRFDLSDGSFYCGECARGAGASLSTLNVLRKCAGQPYDAELAGKDGALRALRLLSAYFGEKTGARVKALGEYIALLGA